MSRVGWLDVSSGASGDMVLGTLLGAGVPLPVLREAVDLVVPEPVTLDEEPVVRNGFAATRCRVHVTDSVTHRDWATIHELLDTSTLHEPVRALAIAIFTRLAEAEAAVHGTAVDDVHFHEVGALDSIADIVGAAAGFVHLGLDRVVCSPVALGAGSTTAAHGSLPVPVPAVVELLRGIPTYGGPPLGEQSRELTTPTGAAILATVADDWGSQPAMTVEAVGVGAGKADPPGHANVLRLLVGSSTGGVSTGSTSDAGALVIEANVDDLDPRLWPAVLAALLDAGASDAWLSPILMKKGRPAHTLHVLVRADAADGVRREIFRQTSTIGVREQTFAKHALDRSFTEVEIDGRRIAVKLAHLEGELVNVQPEYEDVAEVARATGRPVKEVLADAVAAARRRVHGDAL